MTYVMQHPKINFSSVRFLFSAAYAEIDIPRAPSSIAIILFTRLSCPGKHLGIRDVLHLNARL
jgi:hypothetical protein